MSLEGTDMLYDFTMTILSIGGWLLRKAWKIYEKVHREISKHFTDNQTNGKVKVDVDLNHTAILNDGMALSLSMLMCLYMYIYVYYIVDPTDDKSPTQSAVPPVNGEVTQTEVMSRETLNRLLGAVNFGYGMFQLGLSMLPEKVLKLIEFLGFQGDREAGLKALG